MHDHHGSLRIGDDRAIGRGPYLRHNRYTAVQNIRSYFSETTAILAALPADQASASIYLITVPIDTHDLFALTRM